MPRSRPGGWALLVLVGCGGGGEPPASPATVPSAAISASSTAPLVTASASAAPSAMLAAPVTARWKTLDAPASACVFDHVDVGTSDQVMLAADDGKPPFAEVRAANPTIAKLTLAEGESKAILAVEADGFLVRAWARAPAAWRPLRMKTPLVVGNFFAESGPFPAMTRVSAGRITVHVEASPPVRFASSDELVECEKLVRRADERPSDAGDALRGNAATASVELLKKRSVPLSLEIGGAAIATIDVPESGHLFADAIERKGKQVRIVVVFDDGRAVRGWVPANAAQTVNRAAMLASEADSMQMQMLGALNGGSAGGALNRNATKPSPGSTICKRDVPFAIDGVEVGAIRAQHPFVVKGDRIEPPSWLKMAADVSFVVRPEDLRDCQSS